MALITFRMRILLGLVLGTLTLAVESVHAGFVHRSGIEIHDGENRPIKLRGVNVGGWLFWEGWIWGGGWDGETKMHNRFVELAGKEQAARFRDDVYERFIREEDFRRIKEMGFNTVRVPFHYRILEDDANPYSYRKQGWALLDRALAWGEKHNLYIILDLHAAPGAQSGMFVADPVGRVRLWDSEDFKKRTVALWRAIAERYQDRTIIAGYDLINEPAVRRGEELVDLYARIIQAIREVDDNHMIILEGNKMATDFRMFTKPLTENMAYSFHMYTWFGDNRHKKMKEYHKLAKSQKVPYFNGEFGENKIPMIASTVDIYEDPKYQCSGYMFWTWKKVLNRYPPLVQIFPKEGWDQWMGKAPGLFQKAKTPERSDGPRAMSEFLDRCALSKTKENPEMVRALTRYLKKQK